MTKRLTSTATITTVGVIANKWQNHRRTNESTTNLTQEEQRQNYYLDRYRTLSPKVERCLQELIENVQKQNSTLDFELLASTPSQLPPYFMNDSKEYYFDFYIVWKSHGQIAIERDSSSICCKIKYLDQSTTKWSRAEQNRLLISNVDRAKSSFLNGRGLRDLFFETLYSLPLNLVRLDFFEHLIYFDLIIPLASDKYTCHITLLPCLHTANENEVLLPFGTLRWYPRSLVCANEHLILSSLQQPLQNLSIRRYISSHDAPDETSKITRIDQQAFARVRTIIHELLLESTLEHVNSIEQIQAPFEYDDDNDDKAAFFIPHRTDRNCNVFPAGQYLLNDKRAKRFFRDFLRTNVKRSDESVDQENTNVA